MSRTLPGSLLDRDKVVIVCELTWVEEQQLWNPQKVPFGKNIVPSF